MLQPEPKSPSFRQGSRNPDPWMVTCQAPVLDLSTMPSHAFTSM